MDGMISDEMKFVYYGKVSRYLSVKWQHQSLL
jgi:hypothetical protein